MPSPFVVTAVPTSLTLEPGSQQGAFEVTVTNKMGRALKADAGGGGQAVCVADPPSALTWLQPRDKDTTDFGVDETKKFRYGVSVPPNATPQTVKYRVDAVWVGNKDEFFTRGTTVAVTVQTPPPPPPPNGRWKKWLPIAAAVVVVLLVGVGIYKLVGGKGGGSKEVPHVVGMTFDAAKTELGRAKLSARRVDVLNTDTVKFKAGIVFAQDPDSGAARPAQDTVTVRVQRAWSVVPPVVGSPFTQAAQTISLLGLFSRNPQMVHTNNPAQEQIVSSTIPPGLALAGRGDSVTVSVWTTAPTCTPWPLCLRYYRQLMETAKTRNLQARAHQQP